MKIFWTFLMFASSCFVIPVSCTGGMFVGSTWLSHHNQVTFDDGSQPTENFYVLANNSENLDYFAYNGEKSVNDYLKYYPRRSFLIGSRSGKRIVDEGLSSNIKYQVLQQQDQAQIIELTYSQAGEPSVISQYKATAKKIIPLSQRFGVLSFLFDAFPYALAFAIFFSILGKAILSFVNKKSSCILPSCSSKEH